VATHLEYTVVRLTRRLAWVALVLTAACSKDPRIEERQLVVYSPRGCPVAQSEAFSYVYARGDFDETPFQRLFLRDVGTTMSALPSTTRAIVVDVSQQENNLAWWGQADVPPDGEVDVLVWPKTEVCSLTRIVERRTEGTLGVFGRHIAVMGGKPVDTPSVPVALVGDLRTGTLEKLELGLLTPRVHPTITEFKATPDEDPSPALVAGGEDYHENALATAEVYVGKKGTHGDLGDFDRATGIINLSTPRKKHGAVVLRDGSTLLVGGVDNGGNLISTMEIIDPRTRASTSNGIATLEHPRSNPTVIRLADGQILVAGGTDTRDPVRLLEFFAPDGRSPSKTHSVELVTGRERAYVPLAGGGALAVIAPPAGVTDFKSVWVIAPDGSLAPGIPIDPGDLDVVRLYEGAGGAPMLWTGWRWLRWDPWFGAFQPVPDAPTDRGPCLTRSPQPRPKCATSSTTVNGDPGLALWLEEPDSGPVLVSGFRFDVRTQFDNVSQAYLVNSPNGLAPDRIANQPGGAIQFDALTGLSLGPGAAAFLTDVTFGDFALDVEVVGSGPPSIVLRPKASDAFVVGGAACAFTQIATKSLHVERKGKRVRVQADDGELRDCPTELASSEMRVEIGLQGTSGFDASGARDLRVSRR
jgi:hypothetical protein